MIKRFQNRRKALVVVLLALSILLAVICIYCIDVFVFYSQYDTSLLGSICKKKLVGLSNNELCDLLGRPDTVSSANNSGVFYSEGKSIQKYTYILECDCKC